MCSYTVAHYQVHRALLVDSVPYAVVLVALDDVPQVRVIGNVVGIPSSKCPHRDGRRSTWEEPVAEDGAVIRLLHWAPTSD